MNIGVLIILFVIVFSILGIIIYRIVNSIIKEIKEYRQAKGAEKAMLEFLFVISIFPVFLYLGDRYNLFAYFDMTKNISIEYDWLSFIGSYFSTIVSAIFLIYITNKDREASNENVRESQRPYLYTNFETKNNEQIQSIEDEIYMISNSYDDGVEIPILRITNAGESASIIDVAKSYVQIKYSTVEKIKKGKLTTKEQIKKLNFDCVIKRLAIPSNKTVFVCFDDEDFNIQELIYSIEITESYIEYKDLFGKSYVDFIRLNNGKIEVVTDNELKTKIWFLWLDCLS